MSASGKFGEFSDSQLVDWMRCNPGGAAKAFEFWRRSHPEGGNVEFREKVVYKDKVVYQDREVEKVVYQDREVEKVVINPFNKMVLIFLGCSLLFAGMIGSVSGKVKVVTEQVPGPTQVVTETVEVSPNDYESIKSENERLRYNLNKAESDLNEARSVRVYGKPTQSEAYLSLQRENRTLYGILCNRTGINDYCRRD